MSRIVPLTLPCEVKPMKRIIEAKIIYDADAEGRVSFLVCPTGIPVSIDLSVPVTTAAFAKALAARDRIVCADLAARAPETWARIRANAEAAADLAADYDGVTRMGLDDDAHALRDEREGWMREDRTHERSDP